MCAKTMQSSMRFKIEEGGVGNNRECAQKRYSNDFHLALLVLL